MFFRLDAYLPVHLHIRYQPDYDYGTARKKPLWDIQTQIGLRKNHFCSLPHLSDRLGVLKGLFGRFWSSFPSIITGPYWPYVPWLDDLRRRSLHDTELHAVGDQLPSIAVVFYVPWKTQLVRPMVSPMAGPEIKTLWHKEVGPGQWCPFIKMEAPVWLL